MHCVVTKIVHVIHRYFYYIWYDNNFILKDAFYVKFVLFIKIPGTRVTRALCPNELRLEL